MSTPTPDYGEPWRIESGKHSIADTGDFDGYVQIYTRETRHRVAEIWNPDDEHEALLARVIACVNALAGIPDPAAHLADLERERNEAREENARLKKALDWIAKRYDDGKPTYAVAMDAYEMSCTAKHALTP